MSIKAYMRNAVAFSADKLGFLDKAESRMAGTLTILCYHRILPSELKSASAFPDLAVTPGSFRAHCETLKTRYDVQTLSDCVDLLYAGNAGPKPLASITFDDGYRDNYEYAAPVLDSLGLRATFFIIAGLAGKRETPW
mgnify:CR=1 FL=1